ncbi:hypothetical protein NBRC3293_2830 [Gluconobacter oxydans NBRC 3293]|uniref:Transposase n=1 Tax=Gluconobacter oxydans NBRC 3293 TaxID=1315969 RepID=A0A829X2J7_GLUOY|nr:hypothetical protein NBRC3293_2830 [Gluconobacter oxydans NBRC 3293]
MDDWRNADVFEWVFDAMIDATIVKVHRYGQSAKEGRRDKPLAARKAA